MLPVSLADPLTVSLSPHHRKPAARPPPLCWSGERDQVASVLATASPQALQPPAAATVPPSPLRVAVVCSSNMNRSMEAHDILQKRGFCVRSFGVARQVKLPGLIRNCPVLYDFSTTYKQMYKDLWRKNRECYSSNGILQLLGRNQRIKPHPERFQECSDPFDVIFTCEERVYDRVVQDLCAREQATFQPLHVVNVDIVDTLEEATLGAFLIYRLCQSLQQAGDMEDSLGQLLLAAEEKTGKSFLLLKDF
ncbi:RNA polymerase II subunit A C-terminal domain phosphatase SSU72-like isoform X1 [Canis lupus familiaris]|uniref:RNA polymerase II subunit A C-terminal domain phosphatase SSU72-like isoform X1 n=1 Tax=Canis lupus familiaris TaxID=9615 RepID=UPI0018F3CCFA|nr:RNA polymerase II subunit A C-terminal domain phosphatase SSU72-like isoform X1 [Canis lupus familiaris]XP_038425271.1 RNA polymerase II subunit A C-terminal domain phosphatase SSU72-like isoform X1 [Canis lupus familiaris]